MTLLINIQNVVLKRNFYKFHINPYLRTVQGFVSRNCYSHEKLQWNDSCYR